MNERYEKKRVSMCELFLQDEYKYLYDLLLHWYMSTPEYRQYEKDEPENEEAENLNNAGKVLSFEESFNSEAFL